jgi:quercetin dioxygenase-like cupin family protein
MEKYNLKESIDYSSDSIVSKQIYKKESTITLFALDKNQTISEHKAPFDAAVYIIEGKGEFKIGDEKIIAEENDFFIMPANITHSVNATEKFKMMLVMIKNDR